MNGMDGNGFFSGIGAIAAAVLAAGALAAAPAAHADDAGYLARLNAAGVPIPGPDSVRLSTGRYVCAQLHMYNHTGTYRAGTSNGDLIRQLTNTFYFSPEAAQTEIDAAQAELCPDTLR